VSDVVTTPPAVSAALVLSAPVAGDTAQLPRFAWAAELSSAGRLRALGTIRWGYDGDGEASFASAGAGLEIVVGTLGPATFSLASAVSASIGLPRSSISRTAAWDLGLMASPRIRIAIPNGLVPGGSLFLGVPVASSWTLKKSPNIAEPGSPFGMTVGGEVGASLPF
jgi:hypothetical protein